MYTEKVKKGEIFNLRSTTYKVKHFKVNAAQITVGKHTKHKNKSTIIAARNIVYF